MSWASGVRTIVPPVAGTRLTQTRMFTEPSRPNSGVLRVEQRRRPGDGHADRVALTEILDGELRPDLGVLRRQISHQQVLADGRPRSRRGRVRAAALGVDDPFPVAGQD